uniref:Putative peptidase n=1 Tax=viral metagenome TaxID=1070528 RepID=A0A6M3KL01_9ZZZZ
MSLVKKQWEFTRAVSKLIAYAEFIGYVLTFGDVYAKTGHKSGSFHYKRLAVDFNLFINNEYQTTTASHKPLGEYWETLGGTWGGRFDKPDGNHYSWGE